MDHNAYNLVTVFQETFLSALNNASKRCMRKRIRLGQLVQETTKSFKVTVCAGITHLMLLENELAADSIR